MRLCRKNPEVEYFTDMITHNGFVIRDVDKFQPIDIDKLINAEDYMKTEYRCDCGAFIGADLIGQKCPICKSEIALHSLNFKYTGWIDLKQHRVITPVYYQMLKRVLGNWFLRYILGDYKSDQSVKYNENDVGFDLNKKTKKSGRVSQNDIAYIEKKVPKSRSKWKGIGHDEFYKHFEEIILEYGMKTDPEEANILIQEKSAVFTSKIPMYSTAFRPTSKTSETKFYPKINKYFAMIAHVAVKLDELNYDMEIIDSLNCIQNNYIEGSEHLIKNEISKKEGFVRSEIVGGTFSFSARSVITLDITLKADEVDLPYNMVVTAYQFMIAHRLATRYKMTLEQAYIYADGCSRKPEVVEIVDEILAEGQWIFIIREPTNNIKSIELCRIRNYLMDCDVIPLPVEPLPGFNADFDGDQLNLAFLPKEVVPMMKEFRYSCLTNYITEKVTVDLLAWCDICLGQMSE